MEAPVSLPLARQLETVAEAGTARTGPSSPVPTPLRFPRVSVVHAAAELDKKWAGLVQPSMEEEPQEEEVDVMPAHESPESLEQLPPKSTPANLSDRSIGGINGSHDSGIGASPQRHRRQVGGKDAIASVLNDFTACQNVCSVATHDAQGPNEVSVFQGDWVALVGPGSTQQSVQVSFPDGHQGDVPKSVLRVCGSVDEANERCEWCKSFGI